MLMENKVCILTLCVKFLTLFYSSIMFFLSVLHVFIVICSTLRDNKNLSDIQEDAFVGAMGPSFL